MPSSYSLQDEYGDYVRARKHTLRAFSVKLWRVGNKLDLLRSFANCHVLEELDLTGLLLGGRELAVFKPVLRAGLPSLKVCVVAPCVYVLVCMCVCLFVGGSSPQMFEVVAPKRGKASVCVCVCLLSSLMVSSCMAPWQLYM